jgi:hypothetical protein
MRFLACHSLAHYRTDPYRRRSPRPSNPLFSGLLVGEGQRLRGSDVGAPGGVRESELLEEGVGLAGPAKGALHSPLLEEQNGEPASHKGCRFGGRLIHYPVVGTGQELFAVSEAARADQRLDTGCKQGPLVPRFVGRGYRPATGRWREKLEPRRADRAGPGGRTLSRARW